MKRHVIIGQYGSNDRVRMRVARDEVETRFMLGENPGHLDHGIGHALNDLVKLGVYPSEIGLDLLVMASHVHAADTRVSRSANSQDGWTRELRLVVPVSEPDRWTTAIPVLTRLLNFLTGDRWTVGFRARPRQFTSIIPAAPPVHIAPPFDTIALFSGGLDSLIGAINQLEAGSTPLLISHAGEGATSAAQNALFDALKAQYPQQAFNRLRLWMSFSKGLIEESGVENTTRGRSFLFFALGVFAGSGLEQAFPLQVPENGLIALNIPLDTLRLGALSTRTTHPFYIARWNELLNILGIQGKLENPYWDRTKGEMARNCSNATLLRRLVPISMSCSSPAKGRWQGMSTRHCGYCLPCLIRRSALRAAYGSQGDTTTYALVNLRAHALDTRESEGQQVRSFQFAIERLNARPGIAQILIHKPGPLTDESGVRQAALADVYRRGLGEVAALLTGVRTRPS